MALAVCLSPTKAAVLCLLEYYSGRKRNEWGNKHRKRVVRKEHKELTDFLWCKFALKSSYLNLILVKVWTSYSLYNRFIIYQYTPEEAEVTNMSMTRGYWFEMNVIITEEEKQKNEMQVGKYNNTWTTGICPCNTANVRAVQWRVSGWTDGYLWAVLTTYKQIKVIFLKSYT